MSRVTAFWLSEGSVLSPRWLAPIELDGRIFMCADQAVHYEAARLAGDSAAADRILASTSPREQSEIAARIIAEDPGAWSDRREDVAFRAHRAKFAQNPALLETLLATGEAVIAYANPVENYWSCGVSASDPRIHEPSRWLGDNVLGRLLMRIRDELRGAPAEPVVPPAKRLKSLYRELVRRLHPDATGTPTAAFEEYWGDVQKAYSEEDLAMLEALMKLVGRS